MGLFGSRKKKTYICPNCVHTEEKPTRVCKYCNTPMVEELLDKHIVDHWMEFGEYLNRTYIDGHPEREEAAKRRMSACHDELMEGIRELNEIAKARDTLSCPRCNSTAVVVGTRGYSAVTGFIGSGETMNRCGNCGYKWKPRG